VKGSRKPSILRCIQTCTERLCACFEKSDSDKHVPRTRNLLNEPYRHKRMRTFSDTGPHVAYKMQRHSSTKIVGSNLTRARISNPTIWDKVSFINSAARFESREGHGFVIQQCGTRRYLFKIQYLVLTKVFGHAPTSTIIIKLK
jgi:uncharacterized protein YqjF (DUF2071 family)